MSTGSLDTLCQEFHALLDRERDVKMITDEGQGIVSRYAADHGWFIDYLKSAHEDRKIYNEQRASLWPNEITLYRSPDKSLIIFLYIWEPHTMDAVHDHGSWGIIGELISPALERKFRRLDDGSRQGYAELEEIASRVLQPGDTTFVLPVGEGIHQMENPTDGMAVSINVYGRTVRKGFVQYYYPEKKTVRRVFPPRTSKEVLALRTLGAVDRPWAGDILRVALRNSLPDFIRKECEDSLSLIGVREEKKGKGSEG